MATDAIERIDIELMKITIDPDLQPRGELAEDNVTPVGAISMERVTQYAEDMLDGIEFPPVRVFRVTDRNNELYLTSGFHRYHGAEQAGRETIACEVIEGTYKEAMWDAAGTNKEFDVAGARRTNADKRRAVWLAWKAMGDGNHRAIARQVGVDSKTVDRLTDKWKSMSAEKPHSFNMTNEMVDWAKWTWNPVTGCEHNCVYCYARDIANRFYPQKFAPTFHENRLNAPRDTRRPERAESATDPIERTAWRNVFVCSMADLFGRWVPDEWITSVFDSCRQSPEWNYLFLTKFPQRYAELDFPETAWVGTSVDEQKRVANAEKAFRKIEVPVKWLSIEPMLEPIQFSDMKMFDWVVIGGQSRSSQAPEFFPNRDWVFRLIDRAQSAGCKVYCKPNTDPGNHWAGLFKDYPSAFGAE